MNKKSTISIDVNVDEHFIPEKITWEATDSQEPGKNEAKAMMLSLWDKHEANTLRIDLWTKEMTVDEMKAFIVQSILTMGDVFERATNEKEIAEEIRLFGKELLEKIKEQEEKSRQ
ncbi:MAG TPA: gliding motility protein GldC [Flavobacteriales bacterium]|nr:gliding motility protein GldC [Flavobacteriales bacterium]|tara:strand:+ start:15614 stop:15961 length:348 start_codon:yes stop_codon:yes gene_type:complete